MTMHEVYAGFMQEDICITINGKKVFCPEGTSILKAAEMANIYIPTLCYLKGLTPTGACGICAVELVKDGERVVRHACRYTARDGMEIYTETPAVIEYRKNKLEEILRHHPEDCLTCAKSGGNCRLQSVAQELGVDVERQGIFKRGMDTSNPAMYRDLDKCIGCGRCLRVCRDVQKIGVYSYYRDEEGNRYVSTKTGADLNATNCINCGQCVKVCPVGALVESNGIQQANAALNDPTKTVVWQMAPAVQNTIGEEFGFVPGTDVTKKLAAAMKKLGGYAYNTDFSADVTIMEEGTEFIGRVKNGGTLPMMTSCCPGWIKYMEFNYPDLLGHLSSCKSPQQMFGALVKKYLPEKLNVEPENIYQISIMPCVAKKFEYQREEMQNSDGNRDVDLVLTVREAAKLMKLRGINLQELEDAEFDNFMGEWTGAARIFGATGGVMEAALRTVAVILTDGEMDNIPYKPVRGFKGVKEATLTIGDLDVNVAVVNGIGNVKPLLEQIEAGESPYHFIEVMACPGGCINGGGTPIRMGNAEARRKGLYRSDEANAVRRSHENEEVKQLYKDFLGEPCGHESHTLLHTHYVDRSNDVK